MKLKEFEKVAKMLAKEHKIIIQEGEGWSANIKSRDVYYRKEDIYTLPEDHILGLLLHEIAHIHYTTETSLPPRNEALIHTTMNMLEDHSIEHIIGKDYPNANQILEETNQEVVEKLEGMLPKLDEVTEFEKSLLYGSVRFIKGDRPPSMVNYEVLGNKIADLMDKNKNNILNRQKTQDLYPIADEIMQIMISLLGEPTSQDLAKMQANLGNKGTGGQPTASGAKTESVKQKVIEELQGGKGWGDGKTVIETRVSFIDEIADQATIIGKRLRTILKRNNSMEFGGKFRTGKLLAKRLAKIRTTKDRHPFARRVIKSNQSYAFAVAADVSGSMFDGGKGKKNAGSYALSSLQMIAEALKVANIPRSLVVFGYSSSLVCPMGKTQVIWSDIASRKTIQNAGPNGTCINEAMKTCREQLETIKAERKIMIILTDGSSDEGRMLQEHKKATKAGIECLGITIGGSYDSYIMDNVFGKKNRKIKDTKNTSLIGTAFIDILKETVKLSQQK